MEGYKLTPGNIPGRGYKKLDDVAHYKWEPECDIRMDFDTNEYPNIFVSIK